MTPDRAIELAVQFTSANAERPMTAEVFNGLEYDVQATAHKILLAAERLAADWPEAPEQTGASVSYRNVINEM